MNEQELGRLIGQAAAEAHEQAGGAGADVKTYREALAYALRRRGLTVERRTIPPGNYNGVKIARAETVDMVVNDAVIVECKAEPRTEPRFEAQALGHLRMTGLKLALVINFGEKKLRDGIRRVINQEI